MGGFATVDYVRKYIQKLKNYVNVDIQLLNDKYDTTKEQVDINTSDLAVLKNKDIITDLSKTSFGINYFDTHGTNMPTSYYVYEVGSDLTSSATEAGVLSTTITIGEGVTSIGGDNITRAGTWSNMIRLSGENMQLIDETMPKFAKLIDGKHNYMMVRAKINTSLNGISIDSAGGVYLVRLDSNYGWIENFEIPIEYTHLSNGYAIFIYNLTDMVKYINRCIAKDNTFRYRLLFNLFPVICELGETIGSFDLTVEELKYDFLSGSEAAGTSGGNVTVDLSDYYTKTEVDALLPTVQMDDSYTFARDLMMRNFAVKYFKTKGTSFALTNFTPYFGLNLNKTSGTTGADQMVFTFNGNNTHTLNANFNGSFNADSFLYKSENTALIAENSTLYNRIALYGYKYLLVHVDLTHNLTSASMFSGLRLFISRLSSNYSWIENYELGLFKARIYNNSATFFIDMSKAATYIQTQKEADNTQHMGILCNLYPIICSNAGSVSPVEVQVDSLKLEVPFGAEVWDD